MASQEKAPGAASASGSRAGPAFSSEIYWFALIALGAWALAVWTLAPRLARNRVAADREAQLERNVARLAQLERQFEAAIAAMESDPYYREAVYRAVLGVKRADEVFLKSAAAEADNHREADPIPAVETFRALGEKE